MKFFLKHGVQNSYPIPIFTIYGRKMLAALHLSEEYE
jgi:hypothetical protein